MAVRIKQVCFDSGSIWKWLAIVFSHFAHAGHCWGVSGFQVEINCIFCILFLWTFQKYITHENKMVYGLTIELLISILKCSKQYGFHFSGATLLIRIQLFCDVNLIGYSFSRKRFLKSLSSISKDGPGAHGYETFSPF